MQELDNPSRLTACAKGLRQEPCLARSVKQQGEACVAGAQKVRGSVVGGSQRRSGEGQVTQDATGHIKNFAFTLSQGTNRATWQIFEALRTIHFLLNLFSSAVAA